ncbi:MAG TPA: recombinase family protein [Prevotellaceae bacterium]|nr:recombinase family protein [Prevotellaceae bacterium]
MGEKIGYSRLSTREQNFSSQVYTLNNAVCIRNFTDKISGKEFKREGRTACLDYLRVDNTLVIYRLDRLEQSVKVCAKQEMRRIKLLPFQDNLDTSSAVGRFTMQILDHWPSITAILFSKDTNGIKVKQAICNYIIKENIQPNRNDISQTLIL